MRYLVLALFLITAPLAEGADYVQEKKWADEIVPRVVVGDPVYLEEKGGHKFLTLFTNAPNAEAALVVVHGMGVHPDWGLIGTLRVALADAGYATLSVQMPVLASEAKGEDYPATFDQANERLRVAVEFLKTQGHKKIAIVSHSMGSRMTHHFLAKHSGQHIGAWVSIGMSGDEDFQSINPLVLDLYGENDTPAVLKSARERVASIMGRQGARQIIAPNADHFFNNQRGELAKYVTNFLSEWLKSN